MTAKLTNLNLAEVSLVDRGANQHAHVKLFKREFSDDDRKRLAASGAALPDGSFPIETAADLENAIHVYGRAGNKAKAKAHIIARAKSLGCEDKIPEGWHVDKSLMKRIREATVALFKSSVSAVQDAEVVNKEEFLKSSFEEFEKHLEGVVPVELQKSIEAAVADVQKGESMTDEEKKAAEAKAKADKEHEDTKKALEIAKREIAILKMSAKHKDFMDASDMSEDQKDKFAAMSPDERDAHCAKNPIEKRLPEEVRKALAQADEDRKILKSLQEEREVTKFSKRAVDIGLAEAHGEILRKAYTGDADSVKKLEQLIKGLNEQIRTGKVFDELGSIGKGAAATAAGEFETLAKAYQEEAKKRGEKCTYQQAWAKVYQDPANVPLKKRLAAEEGRQVA